MDPQRILNIDEPAIGLHAVIVIDSTHLGPAAGGVRTARYATRAAATADARALARSMTLKCSLSGLDAGGAKAVVIQQEGWDRAAVFRRFGEIVESLGGEFRTAGDLGTTEEDLSAMATTCQFVHTQEGALSDSVALGLGACLQALSSAKAKELSTSTLAIQGCGAIGKALARSLVGKVHELRVTDIDPARASEVAQECAAEMIAPESFVAADVDLLSPCARGDIIDVSCAAQIRAWGICGGANNAITDRQAHARLLARGILVVPDMLASAGGVIDGIGETVMKLNQDARHKLIFSLGDTAGALLEESTRLQIPTQVLAENLAMARLQ